MAVTYLSMDGELISREWYVLLHDIRYVDHVSFYIREGHRTMARQWYFYNLYRFHGGNLAAFPSPWAPHIRTGRPDHAIDFGGAASVYYAALRRGVTLRWTVRGESWHLEADRTQLKAYYEKHKTHVSRVLKFGSQGKDVHKAQVMLRTLGYLKTTHAGNYYGPLTRVAVKKFQRRRGLKADGIIGPVTRRRLRRAYDRKVKK